MRLRLLLASKTGILKMAIKHKTYKQKAQSTLEYGAVVACIVAALIGMQIYIKRSIQGRLRDAADEIGEQYSARTTRSSLTQTISNPTPVTITGTPEFIDVDGQKREIMRIERKESMSVNIGAGSYEETGRLSDEGLF